MLASLSISNFALIDKLGIDFINSLNIDYDFDNIKQTSYNSNFRNTYAGIGFTYDSMNDVFIAPKPYEDWILVNYKWEAPIPYPEDENTYSWDEDNQEWKIVELTIE